MTIKTSKPRLEIKTLKGKSDFNYIVIRSWDDKNNNWEYHVYAEVTALTAADDCWKHSTLLPKGLNTRQTWDKVWESYEIKSDKQSVKKTDYAKIGNYEIFKRATGRIEVFKNKKMLPNITEALKEINKIHKLNVPEKNSKGNSKVPRQLGREMIKYINNK